MGREFKFRVWDARTRMMHTFGLTDTSVSREYTLWEWSQLPVMQFTGLVDKNGQEIYEGDILQDGAGQRFPIVYYVGSFWFNWLHMDSVLEPWEVVGHIYE